MIQNVFTRIKNHNYTFITNNFKSNIFIIVKNLYPKLNDNDLSILQNLTCYLIEFISIRFFSDEILNTKNYNQWTQNNSRDILSISLQLIPFMDGKENNKLYKNITDLNQILFDDNINDIPKKIEKEYIKDILKTKFKYSNFSLGLFNESKTDSYLELIDSSNVKLIHKIIHENLCALLETIKIVNGKLYINWINVSPLNFNNYKDSKIYSTSSDEIKFLLSGVNSNRLRDLAQENKGLYIGDYYNVIRNIYYESIKKVKWVLFSQKTNKHQNGIYMIQYLNTIFDLNKMFEYSDFSNLSESEKNIFITKYHYCISSIDNENNIYDNKSFELNIFQSVLSFLINNGGDKNLIINSSVLKFKLDTEKDSKDLDIIERNLEENELTKDDLVKALYDLEPEYFWNYLKDTIRILKTSIYGLYLVKNNKINMDYFNYETNNTINLKNIYNISKILSHDESRDFNLLPLNYRTLSTNRKVTFFRNFGNVTINFTRNLERQEGEFYNGTTDIIRNIKNGWKDIKEELIWNYLLYNGLISEFKVQPELTDDINLPSNENIKSKTIQEKLKQIFKQNSDLLDSYYYLTNDKYKNIKDIRFDDPKQLKDGSYNKILSYEEALTKKLVFYTYYAMDWISQINFFNHYLNHSILFVTGATGTGKSTQVPKLLLYSLKMIDYKLDGRVICTQPRISPTEGNATWISTETGVPIEYFSKTLDTKVNSENYYLQYKHQKKQHLKDNCSHLSLRMVTDGTLLMNLLKNPLLKEQVKKEKKKVDEYDFGIRNLYDIVIIDEAHEHNTNMDIILTIMRQTCFYNNDIKLVIVSATMDDDEPIYRSYFNMINDNLVFPIRRPLDIHPIIREEDYMIQNIYLDRRIHISAPGKTTMFKIDENYNENIKVTGNNKFDSTTAQEEGYKYIIDICKKSPNGEILFFLTGQREIMEALKYLNTNLPASDIALPFYSAMNSKYRNMIEKIDINIDNIRNNRRDVVDEWGVEYVNAKNVQRGTYKRAIIIATNVAEASITIPRLKYVIDTGYAKVMSFDKRKNTSSLDIELISESSRLQRKGRVGRKSSGTVYYMYSKGAREKIKPKYGITLTNFQDNFLQLASISMDFDNNLGEDPLWLRFLNPYMTKIFPLVLQNFNMKVFLDSLNPKRTKDNLYLTKTNIINDTNNNIIVRQYGLGMNDQGTNEFVGGDYFLSPYFDFYLENDLIPEFLNRKEKGYEFKQLLDLDGLFYIIHPFENKIKRNVLNQIISYENKTFGSKKVNIDINEWKEYINNFKVNLQYLKVNSNDNKENRKDTDIYKKTLLSKNMEELTSFLSEVNLEPKEVKSLFYSSGFGVLNENIQIIALLRSCSYNVTSLAKMIDIKRNDFINLFKKFNDSKSDILAIHKICSLIRKQFSKLILFEIIGKKIPQKYKNEYDMIVKSFKENKFTVDPNKRLKFVKDINLLNRLKNQGKLDSNNGFLYWLSQSNKLKEDIFNDIKSRADEIIRFCNTNYLNPSIISKYFEELYNIYLIISTIDKDIDKKFNEKNPLVAISELKNNFNRTLTYGTIEEKLLYSYILANPVNIAVKKEKYILINGGLSANIQFSFFKISNNYNTLCSGVSSYISYLNQMEIRGEINLGIISNINPKILGKLIPLHYNKKNIKQSYIMGSKEKRVIHQSNLNWDKFIVDVNNSSTKIYFPLKSDLYPVINEYFKKN